jgi:hypothetical protein
MQSALRLFEFNMSTRGVLFQWSNMSTRGVLFQWSNMSIRGVLFQYTWSVI